MFFVVLVLVLRVVFLALGCFCSCCSCYYCYVLVEGCGRSIDVKSVPIASCLPE